MKYVVTIPEIVLLVVTIVTLTLFTSIYPITVPWKPVFASPDTLTLRPNSAGTYQEWSTFGTGLYHWDRTSDQSDDTGVQVTGSTTLKETENLADTSQTGAINSITAYIRAKESGETIEYQQITFVGSTGSTGNNPTFGSFTLPSGWQSGDFAIFWWYTYADTKTFTPPSGVTQKYQTAPTGYGRLYIGYRVLQSGDSTFSWTASSVTSSTTIWGVSVFHGVDTNNPWDADSGTPQIFTNAINPNPPAVTTQTDGAVVYPLFGKRNDYTSITPPSGYTSAGSGSSTAGNDASAGTAYKVIATAGYEDPGAWTLGGGATTDDGQVWTGVLKPVGSNPEEKAVIFWRTHDTDYESSAITISRTAFTDYSETRATNPNTGSAWTWDEINALQIGSRASVLGSTETIQVSEFWIVVDYTLGFNLNLRVRDWDLSDNIQGAYVYKDADVKTSDANGWANWTLVSGTVQIKVQYFGFWVNETSLTISSDTTMSLQCKLYDVIVNVRENIRNAKLSNVNVTVYNSTNYKIKSGISDNNGQVSLLNLPNNTLTFTCYAKSDYSLVIKNVARNITQDEQIETIICDENYIGTTSNYSILVWVGGIVIPLEGSFVTKRLKRKMYKKRKKPK